MDNELAAHRLDGATVILAEDDDDSRALLAFALETCGARVVSAPSARAALALVDDVVPTVLVTDISMPGENGYWLVDEMRKVLGRRGLSLPAVACTALALDDVLHPAHAPEFQRYVNKPFDPFDLCAAVADAIGTMPPRRAAVSLR